MTRTLTERSPRAAIGLLRHVARICGGIAVALVVSAPSALAAPDDTDASGTSVSWVRALWGGPQQSTVYAGMWTRHVHPGVDNNKLVALGYRGVFGGTFINSYHRRSYAVGIERTVWSGGLSPHVAYDIGYRLGGIYGYDQRLLPVAGKVPVVPFAQAVADLSWKGLGVETSFCVRVVTAGFFVRL